MARGKEWNEISVNVAGDWCLVCVFVGVVCDCDVGKEIVPNVGRHSHSRTLGCWVLCSPR